MRMMEKEQEVIRVGLKVYGRVGATDHRAEVPRLNTPPKDNGRQKSGCVKEKKLL